MSRIHVLPEILSNKIAAGEVVERPSSVVKELVENSLDAKSTRIEVAIEKGGRNLIRISDNGMGMGPDDALLALERYATSKIRVDADLFRIHTLGFRGEAVPSIASVSKFELVSREKEAAIGTRVFVNGGKIVDVAEAGAAPGTVISVRQLFFNMPARRKFLKTMNTEMGHVADTLSSIALGFPDVNFRLLHNGRTVKNFPAGDGRSRAVDVLGREFKDRLFAVNRKTEAVTVTGWVGAPDHTRSTTHRIYTYVNGRFIRDRGVHQALFEGYRGRLMKGRYPVAVLFLTVDPAMVDVNVHPTKHQVRFSDGKAVWQAVRDGVSDALTLEDQQKWQGPTPGAALEERRQIVAEKSRFGGFVVPEKTPLPRSREIRAEDPLAAVGSEEKGVAEPLPVEKKPPGIASDTGAETRADSRRETGAGGMAEAFREKKKENFFAENRWQAEDAPPRREAPAKKEEVAEESRGFSPPFSQKDSGDGLAIPQKDPEGKNGVSAQRKAAPPLKKPSGHNETTTLPPAGEPVSSARVPVKERLEDATTDPRTLREREMRAAKERPVSVKASRTLFSGTDAGQERIWENRFYQDLRVIGQLRNTYILCESEGGLVIVDQHAAHERVRYEDLRRRHKNGEGAAQQLLVPELMEFGYKEAAMLEELIPMLETLGMTVEPFGDNSFVMKTVPDLLSRCDLKPVLIDMVEDTVRNGRAPGLGETIDECLILMACHGAIRAHQRLSDQEMRTLFRQLDRCENPSRCPHGRPIWVQWEERFLEKSFGRTG